MPSNLDLRAYAQEDDEMERLSFFIEVKFWVNEEGELVPGKSLMSLEEEEYAQVKTLQDKIYNSVVDKYAQDPQRTHEHQPLIERENFPYSLQFRFNWHAREEWKQAIGDIAGILQADNPTHIPAMIDYVVDIVQTDGTDKWWDEYHDAEAGSKFVGAYAPELDEGMFDGERQSKMAQEEGRRQQSCEERIEGELESELARFREVWDAYIGEADEDSEYDEDSLFDYGLSIDYVAPYTFREQDKGYLRWQVSYGGPSDEWRFYMTEGFNLDYVDYVFMDWFDGATRTLYGSDLAFMREIFDWLSDMGTPENEYEKAMDDYEPQYPPEDEEEEEEDDDDREPYVPDVDYDIEED